MVYSAELLLLVNNKMLYSAVLLLVLNSVLVSCGVEAVGEACRDILARKGSYSSETTMPRS